jgi:hypothetical protein
MSAKLDIPRAYLHFLSENLGPGGRPKIRGLSAAKIGALLRENTILMAIINACDSAKSGVNSDGNLAQTFVRAGIPTVLAMSFKALATAVESFFKEFYAQFLIQGCSFEVAVWRARQHIATNRMRKARFGITVSIEDWISPVVYQLKGHIITPIAGTGHVPHSLQSIVNHQNFNALIGRDLDIFQLEMLLHHSNTIELYGDSGVGKTALLNHLSYWWKESHYIENTFVFGGEGPASSLNDICRSVCEFINSHSTQMTKAEPSIDNQGCTVERTIRFLRQHRCLLVLDDFCLTIGSTDRVSDIRKFLSRLDGGRSLALFTSLVPRTRATRYRLEGLPRFAALELLMTRMMSKADSKVAEAELRYMDWLLETMTRLPGCIEVIVSMLQVYSNSPKLLFEALLNGVSALDERICKTVQSQAYLTASRIYHECRPSVRAVLLLLSPFWGCVPAESLNDYVYLVWEGRDFFFPSLVETLKFHQTGGSGEEVSLNLDGSENLGPEYHLLLDALELGRKQLIASNLWTLQVSIDGARTYRIHPMCTLCLRKIAEEQGDDFKYDKLLRVFAMWHRSRELRLWNAENTIESVSKAAVAEGSHRSRRDLTKKVQWTEEWLCEQANLLTSFYVGLSMEKDEVFQEVFPFERFFHLANGIVEDFYTDHIEKKPGPTLPMLEIPSPSPYLIMELAEQTVERAKRILNAGKPLGEQPYINILFNALWTSKFHLQYSSPTVTRKSFEIFLYLFSHAQNIPVREDFQGLLRSLKMEHTILLAAFYWSILDDDTLDNASYCLMDDGFLSDLRKVCEMDEDEAPLHAKGYCQAFYAKIKESNQFGSNVLGYESRNGFIDVERFRSTEFEASLKDVLQLVDDRFGDNQDRAALLHSLDKAMESGNSQLQLSLHSVLCANAFQAKQWRDAAFHGEKVLELDKDFHVLSSRTKLNIMYNLACIAKEVGKFGEAKAILLDMQTQTSPEDWVAHFDTLALLGQVQFQGGWDRWATIDTCASALKIAYSKSAQFLLHNHKSGQLFAFIFQSLWTETSAGTAILDEDIARFSEMLGSSPKAMESELSRVNQEQRAISNEIGVVFARAELAIFGRSLVTMTKDTEVDLVEGSTTISQNSRSN